MASYEDEKSAIDEPSRIYVKIKITNNGSYILYKFKFILCKYHQKEEFDRKKVHWIC